MTAHDARSRTARSSTRSVSGDQAGRLGQRDEGLGLIDPRLGCRQRASASNPISRAIGDLDLRLVTDHQVVAVDRLAQIVGPLLGLRLAVGVQHAAEGVRGGSA